MPSFKEKINAVLLMLAMLLGVILPLFAIAAGLIIVLFNNPKAILQILTVYAGLALIVALVYKLASHPKTKAITQALLYVLAISFFIHSCNSSSTGCISTRYFDCEN